MIMVIIILTTTIIIVVAIIITIIIIIMKIALCIIVKNISFHMLKGTPLVLIPVYFFEYYGVGYSGKIKTTKY